VVNPLFVLVDLAVVVVAVRSLRLVAGRAACTTIGWVFVVGYGAAGAVKFSTPPLHQAAGIAMTACLVGMAAAFVAAGVRDEPQAEPLLWPQRLGRTRAQRRNAR
jgi:hypothetical protein